MEGMLEQGFREEYAPLLVKIKELKCVPDDIKEDIEILLEKTRKINERYGIETKF